MSRARTLLAILLLGLLAGCYGSTGSISVGEPVPFLLSGVSGSEIAAKDFAGKVVLLEFWASWCGPCKIQAEILETMESELEDKGVQIVAVNLGEDPERVREHAAEQSSWIPVALDPESDLAVELGVYALPTLVAIDREGRLSGVTTGVHSKGRVRRIIEKAEG